MIDLLVKCVIYVIYVIYAFDALGLIDFTHFDRSKKIILIIEKEDVDHNLKLQRNMPKSQ